MKVTSCHDSVSQYRDNAVSPNHVSGHCVTWWVEKLSHLKLITHVFFVFFTHYTLSTVHCSLFGLAIIDMFQVSLSLLLLHSAWNQTETTLLYTRQGLREAESRSMVINWPFWQSESGQSSQGNNPSCENASSFNYDAIVITVSSPLLTLHTSQECNNPALQ